MSFFIKLGKAAADRAEKYCSDPFRVLLFFAVSITCFYTLQCSLLQNVLGLDILETISWGAQKAWGHAKHPPLSGWLGYNISRLGGHQDWIMYLAAQSCMLASVIYVYRCARLFLDKFTSATAALMLYFLFYYNPSETRFCTYPLETALVPAASFYFLSALRSNKMKDHLLAALLTAAGIMNKYSFFLVIAAWGVIFFKDKENLKLLKSVKTYIAVLLLLCLLSPHINWLTANDFICFSHVGNRLADTFKWYTPFVTAGTALYPYLLLSAILFLALLPDLRTRPRKPFDKTAGITALLIGGIPAAALIVLSCFGNDIIMMWFCTMASFSGIALTAFFPRVIDRRFFTRIVLLLAVYCVCMMTATTLDLLISSRVRLHSRPENYTGPAMEFYKKHAEGDIPVVAGPRFEATLLENYLPNRPPACELNDPIALERCREKIWRSGALLISRRESFSSFLKALGYPEPEFKEVVYSYKAPWGRKRQRSYKLTYLPPKQEKKNRNIPAVTDKN